MYCYFVRNPGFCNYFNLFYLFQGMIFLHESLVQYHGALRPSNCLVDARWVVKLADFGLRAFRHGELPPSDPTALQTYLDSWYYKILDLFLL